MIPIKCQKKHVSVFCIILLILFSSFLIITINHNQIINSPKDNRDLGADFNKSKNPRLAAQETLTAVWLENPTFEDPIEEEWYSERQGDLSDVQATTSSGQVNFKVIGEIHEEQILLDDAIWEAFNKTENALSPQRNDIPGPYYGVDETGAWCTHRWYEWDDGWQPKNTPEIYWKTNVSLDYDMSGYNITSVDFDAVINGTVDTNVETPDDTTPTPTQHEQYDYAQFFVEISTLDINELETYRIAFNQTINLGRDAGPALTTIQGQIGIYSEKAIINALNNVLEADPDHSNFTVIMGIYIYCEDNDNNYDTDTWTKLRFNSLNLTFTYEKKINQFTAASWNQDADKISNIIGNTVVVNEAKLNFKYWTDGNWSDTAYNSEFRVYFNNNKLSKTIKLRDVNSTHQLASKTGGYDVKSLIPYDTEINFSLQLYLAETFTLDQDITFSIDDVYLNITYTVTFDNYTTNLQVFFDRNNRTETPIYEHPVGHDLNITVKYPDELGNHISGAVVELSGNLTGTLIENETLEQYTIIIDADDLNVGSFYIKIVAHKINYEISAINAYLTISPYVAQDLELFLNGGNKTSDPSFEISLDKLLNITVKYYTSLGTPVTGATVSLSGGGILESLNESTSFNQYSIILNTTKHFIEGDNPLTITASKLNYQTGFINPRINVRKINSLITPVNNTNTISIKPGGDAFIQVYINNTDFNELIKGVNVTYSWDSENGFLEDFDNDGIYEVNLTDIPAGTHSIMINAYGRDKYDFISLEIIVAAIPPADTSFIFRILLTIAIIASIALAGYIYAYQKVLKFPRVIRKVRKYKRTLKRSKAPRLSIFDRKKAFDLVYQKEMITTSRFLKVKTKEEEKEKESPEKVIEKVPENSELKKQPVEPSNQNTNSYNINRKSKDKTNYHTSFRRRLKILFRRKWTGSLRMNNKGRLFFLITIFIILIMGSLILNPHSSQNSVNNSENSENFIINEDFNKLGLSAQKSDTKQWLNNTDFTTYPFVHWYSSYGVFGDNSDVRATSAPGNASFEIIGETYEEQVILNESTYGDWKAFNKSENALVPQVSNNPAYDVDETGAWCSHTWEESGGGQAKNTPVMHWKTNVSLDYDMSGYNITSVAFDAVINGTVDVDDIETPGDDLPTENQFEKYDYAQFYVEISTLDVDELETYRIAFNQTLHLGRDTNPGPALPTIQGQIGTYSEEAIINALNNVLEADPDHSNFTVVLGIFIYCEDNDESTDTDTWIKLRFKSLNLTFTYERKIDQFTSVSWNQDADNIKSISTDDVRVDEAIINFKYWTDGNWTEVSPNSEIRIINNIDDIHPETIKLSTANNSFQEADFDITPLIIEDVNLSIQVFLADEFGLDHNITVTVDEVTLNITYTIIFDDYVTDLHVFLNGYNATLDPTPTVNINIGESLNITINYLNATTGLHIPNATVYLSGNFTGTLEEDEILEQYTIIINTDLSDAGINFVTITAQAENHEPKEVIVQINVDKFSSSNMQIFLNYQDVTPDPYITIIKNEILNISVKYETLGGSHISGASVLLTSQTYSSYLIENVSLENYYIIINTTDRLDIGDHFFTVKAQSDTYKTQTEEITVSIRKINLEIISVSGLNTIETRTGASVRLRIRLNNTDFGGDFLGAFVSYSWENKSGILEDENNDGIYEDIIPDFPEGTYDIKISAFAGDDYYIEDYEIYASATSEVAPENIIFPILLGVSIAIFSGLVIYLYAYYTYLKFPKQVRKVRKYRKTLNRKSPPTVSIMDRESDFKRKYSTELGKTSKIGIRPKLKKLSTSEQEPIADIDIEKPIEQKIVAEKLIKEAVEKKEELDKLVDKSLDRNTNPSN